MKTKFVCLLMFLFIGYCVTAQNEKKVNGIVRSAKDKEPLAFASVGIIGTGLGTVTNESGIFTLVISPENIEDSLTISYIGYKSWTGKIKLQNDTAYFDIVPETYLLAEVVILPGGITPASIFSEALKRIPKNYSSKPFYQQAFYREMATLDKTYTRLIEAAIEIQDFGYDAIGDRLRLKVIELRKSDDFIERDWRDFLVNKIYGSSNDIIKTLDNCDLVRQMYKMRNEFDPKTIKITLRGISRFDDDEVYEIEIENTKFYLPNSTLYYIKTSDYAIIQIDRNYHFPVNPSSQDKKVLALSAASKWETKSIYRKVGDKYYLFYGKFQEPASFSAIKEETGLGNQFMQHEILVNNIITKRVDWDRVKRKERQVKDSDIYDQDFEYHPGFWSNYTILLRNPLLKQVITDLNRGKTLEEQFYDNGK